MRAQLKAMPFSTQSEITSGATTIKTFVEFESRQRVRVTTASGSAVLYDGKFFVKEGQAAWREDNRAAATINGFLAGMLDSAAVEAVIGMIKTVKQVGSETLDGIPCRIYEYTYAGEQFGVSTSGKVRLWVAEDDALPIKQITESEAAGYSATSTIGYDYGPSLSVDPPIK
jgi:hypothetical protein